MSDPRTNIRITADPSDADRKLKGFLADFSDRLKTGFGIDFARRMTRGLELMARKLRDAVQVGVTFNSTLENTQGSLGGILRTLAPDSFKGFNDALSTSQALIRGLREEAKKSTASFEELVGASQGLLGPALSAGVPLQKIPALVAMVSRAVKANMPGAPSFQILQEGRAMLTGDLQGAQLAYSLGFSKPLIDQARTSGRMFEFLEERLRGFNEAGDYMAHTLTGLKSNLEDLFRQGMGEAMTDVFERLKELLAQLQVFVASDEFNRLAGMLGQVGARTGEDAVAVTKWAGHNNTFLRRVLPGI